MDEIETEDIGFLKRLNMRDEEAWREFSRRYRSLCYFLAKRYNCQLNFEDFYAELLLRLMTKDLPSFDIKEPLSKLVARRFSDIISAYLHKSRRHAFGRLYESVSLEPSAAVLAEREELYCALENAREMLTEDENLLLKEYFEDNLPLIVIAEKRGLHSSTVIRRLKKIYGKLARLMERC